MIDRLLFTLPGSKKIMVKLVGLYVLQAFLIIGQGLSLAYLLTQLWAGKSWTSQWQWLLIFVACFTARHLTNWWEQSWLDQYARSSANHLRASLLQKLFKLGPALIVKEGTGNMVTLSLDGISEVETYINLLFSKFVSMMVIPILLLIVCLYLDWISGLTMLFIYPLIILFMIILGYAAKAKADRQYATFQMLSNHFIDSLRGIDTLKYFGISKPYANSIFRSSELFRKSTMSVIKVAMLSTFALDFFTTLAIAILAVFLGLRLINGHLLLFPALAILILAPEYFMPIRNFANDYHATLNGKNSFHAVERILHLPEVKQPDVQLHQWQATDRLTLKNISYRYQSGTELQPVDLTLTGYQKVGIIGMSGAGKTTLINLLAGFLQPRAGQMTIQGHSVATLDIADWQRQIMYIPQHPYIFEDTLANNIAFYTPDVDQKQIEQAVHVVGLDDLVASLPDGLQTKIGNGHRPLSGGQAQRIALARAFLDQKRKVLILDEPTAHLDIETELELKERMIPLMKDRLVLFATHRLHWLDQMDQIIVLNQGQVVETGTYDSLMKEQGYFTDLINQMRGGQASE